MTRKFSLMLVMLLAFTSTSQAITISADKNANLGDMASGSSLTINLKAGDYKAPDASKIRWSRKFTGRNPGLEFDVKRGESVKFSSASLFKAPISSSEFSVIITAKDVDGSEASLTFTGNVLHAPLIKTDNIAEAQSGSGKKYSQRFELNRGSEPVEWEISGDLPEGISLTTETNSRGKIYHVLAGTTEEAGEFPFTLSVKNSVGSDTKDFVLKTGTSGARIKFPENFVRSYTVMNNTDFSLDLGSVNFLGTKPLKIDIDEAAKTSGLVYDDERKIISGKISSDKEKLRVKLIASNAYSEPVSSDLVLNVKSAPDNIEVFTAKKSWQNYNVVNGRAFNARFRASKGSKPITWEFFKADDNSAIKEFNGLTFSENGNISGTPNGSEDIKFYAVASNIAGKTQSGVYELFFSNFPLLNFTEPVSLRNNQEVNIDLRNYLTRPESAKFPVEFTINGKIPEGLTLNDGKLTGTLNITNPAEVKNYSLNVTASNASGTSKGWLTLQVKDAPKIGEIDTANLTGKIGRRFLLRIPTNTKQPYSWRLVYNGEDVNEESEYEIGDSGLAWNIQAGEIYSAHSLNDGAYPVTVYLSNDLGVDTKTFTITIRR